MFLANVKVFTRIKKNKRIGIERCKKKNKMEKYEKLKFIGDYK